MTSQSEEVQSQTWLTQGPTDGTQDSGSVHLSAHLQAGFILRLKMGPVFQLAHPGTTHREEKESDFLPVVPLWRCSLQMFCCILLALMRVTCLFLYQ